MNDIQGKFCVITIRFNDEKWQDHDTVVPTSYIMETDGKTYVQFMKPPYTEDDLECIESFVKSAINPPEDGWTLYECSIKASGSDYDGALQWMLENNSAMRNKNNNIETTVEDQSVASDLFAVPDLQASNSLDLDGNTL